MRFSAALRSDWLALFLLLWPSLACTENQKVDHNPSVQQILAGIKASTRPVEVSAWGGTLAARGPETEEETKLLLDALKDERTAPHAQMAIAKATAPALGAVLHEGLRALRKELRKVDDKELKNLPYSDWQVIEQQAMNVAAVIHALGSIKYQPAAADLRELLNYDDKLNGYISWEASNALIAMGDETGTDLVMERAGQNKPINLSGTGAKGVRKILQKIDDIEATFQMTPKKYGDPRGLQIDNLGDELAQMDSHDSSVKEALRHLLAHKHERVRWGASESLARNLDRGDKDISSQMLRHKDFFVRKQGLKSLRISKTWDRSLMPIVLDMLRHDPDAAVRVTAARTLHDLVGVAPREELKEAVPHLMDALKDPSISVRYSAFDALRLITGRFFPYEGMWDDQKRQMEREPADLYSR